MKKFYEHMKKYLPYIKYAAKCDLKSEVASSRLNWLWWILDPLCFMLVYMFISLVVFNKKEEYFAVFVFLGLTIWNFFSKTVSGSVLLMKQYKSTVSKIYVPKYILILQKIFVNLFKMLVSFMLVAVLMFFYKVPLSWNILHAFPLLIVLIILTFGFSTIIMHFGVFFSDLSNIITVLLRLVMYLSGIFYSILKNVPAPFNLILLKVNPVAYIIDAMRQAVLYSCNIDWKTLGVWMIVGVIVTIAGVNLVYKYENSYVKVI